LEPLKEIQTNDQHDGALIPIGAEIPDTGYIRVTPKHIADPDPRHAVEVCGKQIEIIPFSTSGPANMADIIMAAGARHTAVQEGTAKIPRKRVADIYLTQGLPGEQQTKTLKDQRRYPRVGPEDHEQAPNNTEYSRNPYYGGFSGFGFGR
jgi:hypothetical protein